jgi:hypothetical protein
MFIFFISNCHFLGFFLIDVAFFGNYIFKLTKLIELMLFIGEINPNCMN